MGEQMTFPNTWEEFEAFYGFDDKEQIYTNGSRLIPSFRAEQWLNHLPQWIPCSERLPGDSVDILLWHKEKGELDDEVITYDQIVIAMYDKCEKKFYGLDYLGRGEFPIFDEPIAWAPLPEPWKGDEDA